MHAVVRQYRGASTLIDEMEQRQSEIEEIIAGVNGFNAYYAVRRGDELTTITVCSDQIGTEQSTGLAADWVRENLPGLTSTPPAVSDGEVFLAFQA